MIGKMRVVCVIPARLHSSRFPKKILAPLCGKPLLQWTWEAALRIPFFDEVVIGVDAEETASAVEAFQGKWIMTSPHCLNGTERLIEIQARGEVQGDVWVNWQADEPFLSRQTLIDLLQSCEESPADLWTLRTPLEEDMVDDPSLCKVVVDAKGFALYFSRAPIPYARKDGGVRTLFKHIGLYAYRDQALRKIASMPPCEIELAEMLEQLRFLYHGLKMEVHQTKEMSLGIDLPEHLICAKTIIEKETLFSEA